MASFADKYGGWCTCTRDKCSDECKTYRKYKPKPTTNADRIRAMTDEELAEQLYLLRLDALRLEGYDGFIETKDEILDWLKEEADNG